jgi:hypothetical protein
MLGSAGFLASMLGAMQNQLKAQALLVKHCVRYDVAFI